jgi:putative FmdB family regulatory protein
MPIFEYRCASCDGVFEHLRLGSHDTQVECPHCGGRKAQQLISRFAAQTGRGGGDVSDCYNRSAGICEAGGGALT